MIHDIAYTFRYMSLGCISVMISWKPVVTMFVGREAHGIGNDQGKDHLDS